MKVKFYVDVSKDGRNHAEIPWLVAYSMPTGFPDAAYDRVSFWVDFPMLNTQTSIAEALPQEFESVAQVEK